MIRRLMVPLALVLGSAPAAAQDAPAAEPSRAEILAVVTEVAASHGFTRYYFDGGTARFTRGDNAESSRLLVRFKKSKSGTVLKVTERSSTGGMTPLVRFSNPPVAGTVVGYGNAASPQPGPVTVVFSDRLPPMSASSRTENWLSYNRSGPIYRNSNREQDLIVAEINGRFSPVRPFELPLPSQQ